MAKNLRSNVYEGGLTVNPTVIPGVPAAIGTLLVRRGTTELWRKFGAAATDWQLFSLLFTVTGPFTAVGAPHPVTCGELAQANMSAGTFDFTLPAIGVGNSGCQLIVKKVAGGGASFRLVPAGLDTVEGFAGPFSVPGALASVTLVSNGISNWMVV